MKQIKIRYFSDEIEHLRYIDGKSDWIDLRCAERTWGLLQANSMGIVDRSYCGDNDQWRLPVYATRDTVIEVNDRICQFRIMENQPKLEFLECEHLSGPDRGGFGSTGRA